MNPLGYPFSSIYLEDILKKKFEPKRMLSPSFILSRKLQCNIKASLKFYNRSFKIAFEDVELTIYNGLTSNLLYTHHLCIHLYNQNNAQFEIDKCHLSSCLDILYSYFHESRHHNLKYAKCTFRHIAVNLQQEACFLQFIIF